MRKARWTSAASRGVCCHLCEKECRLALSGECGPCGVRESDDGALWTRAEDRFTRLVARPIEALGLYHVLPGARALAASFPDPSAAAAAAAGEAAASPDEPICRAADLPELARAAGAAAVAFTGPEPTWQLEALLPALDLVRHAGLLAVVKTRAGVTGEALDLLARGVDAVSIRVPTLEEGTARRLGAVPPHRLRAAIATLRRRSVWVEATTVLVPGVNDSDAELLEIALSLRGIGEEIPWHVRCSPQEERMLARWAETAIERALAAGGQAGLEYVYAAEAPGADRELTFCHVCRDVVLIERFAGQPRVLLRDGVRCPRCRTRALGVFERGATASR
jgi:pyruvate formate lyase activating enzyme